MTGREAYQIEYDMLRVAFPGMGLLSWNELTPVQQAYYERQADEANAKKGADDDQDD